MSRIVEPGVKWSAIRLSSRSTCSPRSGFPERGSLSQFEVRVGLSHISRIFGGRESGSPSRPPRPDFALDVTQCELQHFRQMKCFPPRGLQYLLSTAKAIRNNQSLWRGLSNGGQQDSLSNG